MPNCHDKCCRCVMMRKLKGLGISASNLSGPLPPRGLSEANEKQHSQPRGNIKFITRVGVCGTVTTNAAAKSPCGNSRDKAIALHMCISAAAAKASRGHG